MDKDTVAPDKFVQALEKIARTGPETPRGWFRWLHHGYLSRMKARVDLALQEEWTVVAQVGMKQPLHLNAKLRLEVEVHAWQIGLCGHRSLAEAFWTNLSPGARGQLLAGFSNHLYKEPDALTWIQDRIPDADLNAESVLEIACNAVMMQSDVLLGHVLKAGSESLSREVERLTPFDGMKPDEDYRFAKDMASLSNTVIDMVLEGSVMRGWAPGARIALAAGANPSLTMWVLERSYNEHHSALSLAIRDRKFEMVEVLLEAGSKPCGMGGSKALYLAITQGDTELADHLIERGASFEFGDVPCWWINPPHREKAETTFARILNISSENLEQARILGNGLPLSPVTDVAWFYRGNGQGGSYSNFMQCFVHDDDLQGLRHFVGKGLPVRFTLLDLATSINRQSYDVLTWMIEQWNTPIASGLMRRLMSKNP